MAKISEIKLNINLTTLIIIGVVLLGLIIGGFGLYQQRVNKLNDKLETETKLRNALLDTVKNYQNKEKEWVAEKLTIQVSLKNLEKIQGQLTANQKEMLDRIKEVNKKNDIITAALIQTQVKIDSLIHNGKTTIDTIKKQIIFSDYRKDGNKEVRYKFIVGNVLPSPLTAKPSLLIDSLSFPNKQFIEFHWKKEKKNGYPISFTVSNSNDYFKTVNIDSYAIPELSKEKLNPNGWQKIGNFFIRNGKTVIYISVGAVVGATATYFIINH